MFDPVDIGAGATNAAIFSDVAMERDKIVFRKRTEDNLMGDNYCPSA